MVPERILTQAIGELQNPERICDYLIDAANRNGGADNITVICGGSRRLLVATPGESLVSTTRTRTRCPKLTLQLEDRVLKAYDMGMTATIGRLSHNSVMIDSPAVSSHHACVFRDGDQLVLEDLHSTNGTFVNGTLRLKTSPPVVFLD